MKRYQRKEDLPLFLNAEDIQCTLRISRASAYQLMHSENFPTILIGKRMVCQRDAFFLWLDNQTGGKEQQ